MNNSNFIVTTLVGSAIILATITANATSGVINFTGNIQTAACTVSTASQNQEVQLGNVAAADFTATGATTANGKISVVLSACPESVTAAAVSFGGPADQNNGNLLALSASSTAKNVAIALFESDSSTAIPLATKTRSFPVTASAETTLTYFARYQSTAPTVTEGSANAAADFTVLYN